MPLSGIRRLPQCGHKPYFAQFMVVDTLFWSWSASPSRIPRKCRLDDTSRDPRAFVLFAVPVQFDMYKPIQGHPSPASRMQALRTSYRALGAQPAYMAHAARASTKASAKADGDLAQSDVVKKIAAELNYDQSDVATVVNKTLDVISETVSNGNKVSFKGAANAAASSNLLATSPNRSFSVLMLSLVTDDAAKASFTTTLGNAVSVLR